MIVKDKPDKKNRLVHRRRISDVKFHALFLNFNTNLTATQIADLTGLNRKAVNAYRKNYAAFFPEITNNLRLFRWRWKSKKFLWTSPHKREVGVKWNIIVSSDLW